VKATIDIEVEVDDSLSPQAVQEVLWDFAKVVHTAARDMANTVRPYGGSISVTENFGFMTGPMR
jgi:hypothetical protein